jgi:uncharacterized membrane protein YphA (DoxX/SURF4 family)
VSTRSPAFAEDRDAALRRMSVGLVLALVVLRFCTGLHFYSEGTKKLNYDSGTGKLSVVFSAEGFLRGAVGPLAEFYHSKVPNFHEWEKHLAVPRSALESHAASPAEAWLEQIRADLLAQQKAFAGLRGLSKEQQEAGAAAYEFRLDQVNSYLEQQRDAIAQWQHELWRLKQMKDAPTAKGLPFQAERIADLEAETSRTPLEWVAQVRGIERGYHDDLRAVVTAEQRAAGSDLPSRITDAVTDPKEKQLARMNLIITCVITGVGGCLMLGLLTRLASVIAVAFLLSVMASQPPWIEGARADVFYYQLVEVCALLVLFAAAAGRWLGLDAILRRLVGK